MRVIIVPDEGEWVLVPKVNNALPDAANGWVCISPQYCPVDEDCLRCGDCKDALDIAHKVILAATPPTKVVELPERMREDNPELIGPYECGWVRGANWYRDEIERRAK